MIVFAIFGCITGDRLANLHDQDGDGFAAWQVEGPDCDDTDPTVNPSVAEVCDDGVDNNCDGHIDDAGVDEVSWFRDDDGDGIGTELAIRWACASAGAPGWVLQPGDCDDSDPTVSPAIPDDSCDGVDNDCDGVADQDGPMYYTDNDGDGAGTEEAGACAVGEGTALVGKDCDDEDAAIRPGAPEVCDGVDNDCDGQADDVAAATVDGLNYAALEDAIAAASSGQAVRICPGTYVVQTISPPTTANAFLNLVGAQGAAVTTLESASGNAIVWLEETANATLQGLSFTGASKDSAIVGFGQVSLSLLDSRVHGNFYTGVELHHTGLVSQEIEIQGVEFDNNEAHSGSAIVAIGNVRLNIVASDIHDNVSLGDLGVVRLGANSGHAPDVTILDSIIRDNDGMGVAVGLAVDAGPEIVAANTDWGTVGLNDNSPFDVSWGVGSWSESGIHATVWCKGTGFDYGCD